MIPLEPIFVVAGLLLIVSVVASKAAARTGVPALLIFLGIGMLAGSEGLIGIEFDNPAIAHGGRPEAGIRRSRALLIADWPWLRCA
jgi:NhaP-type Na+/H+ and K+/H+ antiporter